MNEQYPSRLTAASKAAAIHLGVSLLVAILAALLVFGLWYPYPYRELAGGRELFLLIMGVDLVCGPILTLVIFNPAKPKKELIRDLTFVAVLQLTALMYGIHTVATARPIYMVFEVDRMRVITAADVQYEDLTKVSSPWDTLPWTGPKLIGVREPLNVDEQLKSIDLSLNGNDPSVRPSWWQDYKLTKNKAVRASKPISELRIKYPTQTGLINSAILASGQLEQSLRWMPLTSFKTSDWIVFLDIESALPKAYLPLDGF
jgi:hypothetical protein